jgi:hypothetical protein
MTNLREKKNNKRALREASEKKTPFNLYSLFHEGKQKDPELTFDVWIKQRKRHVIAHAVTDLVLG